MARIRTIKPEFWADEKMAGLPRDARLLFIGLLNFADDEGRLRGNPLLIRSQVFPYDADVDSESLLRMLADRSVVLRYEVEGESYIWVKHFGRHQKIDRPTASTLPAPPQTSVRGGSAKARRKIADGSLLEGKGREGNGTGKGMEILPPQEEAAAPTAAVWEAYSVAYEKRYQHKPTRDATVNSQLSTLVKRLGAEAPAVAEFYVAHNKAYYIEKCHAVGPLVVDYHGLRLQWARGVQVTTTKARQEERTQENVGGWMELAKGPKHGVVGS